MVNWAAIAGSDISVHAGPDSVDLDALTFNVWKRWRRWRDGLAQMSSKAGYLSLENSTLKNPVGALDLQFFQQPRCTFQFSGYLLSRWHLRHSFAGPANPLAIQPIAANGKAGNTNPTS